MADAPRKTNAPPLKFHLQLVTTTVDQHPRLDQLIHRIVRRRFVRQVENLGMMVEGIVDKNTGDNVSVVDVRASPNQVHELERISSRSIQLTHIPCNEGGSNGCECITA